MEGGENDSQLTIVDYVVDFTVFSVWVQRYMIGMGKEKNALDGGVDNLLREIIRPHISCDANSVAPCCLDLVDDGRQAFLVNASQSEKLSDYRLKVVQKATARTRLPRSLHPLSQTEALCSCQFPGNPKVNGRPCR